MRILYTLSFSQIIIDKNYYKQNDINKKEIYCSRLTFSTQNCDVMENS
jgi:hypothetical protein